MWGTRSVIPFTYVFSIGVVLISIATLDGLL